MFLLYQDMYVLMELVVNLQNEDLQWFSGKKSFIDGGMSMGFTEGEGSRVTIYVFMQFYIFRCWCVIRQVESCRHQMFLLVSEVF